MKTPLDKEINGAYEAFNKDHDHLRQILMASLPRLLTQHKKTSRIAHIKAFIGDTIMKSRITKLAAAAVIIIAVLVGIEYFGGSVDIATPAFADIVRPLLTARTITFKTTVKVEGAPPQTFDCMFAEPLRMRQTSQQGPIVITDLQQGKIISLMPAQKTAMVMQLENVPEIEDESQFNIFHGIRKTIKKAQETEDESVEFLGEQEINGLPAIGYRIETHGMKTTIWADVETELPIQIESSWDMMGSKKTDIMSDFVFDAELDESLFSLEIPEGYSVQTIPVDAAKPSEKDLIEMLRMWAETTEGEFPSTLDLSILKSVIKEEFEIPFERKLEQEKKLKPAKAKKSAEQELQEMFIRLMPMGRGWAFLQSLPAKSDWHYAGKDVQFGDANMAIFWYRPEGSETYRVIYGDLSIKDVAPENLPK